MKGTDGLPLANRPESRSVSADPGEIRWRGRIGWCLALASIVAGVWLACGDATGGSDSILMVMRTDPADQGRLFLNQPIAIEFNHRVDLDSVGRTTVVITAHDRQGQPLSEKVDGEFRLATLSGDTEPGRRLEFVPRLPTNAALDNGGFRPGREYVVRLPGGADAAVAVRDASGNKVLPCLFRLFTVDGTTREQLFRPVK